MDSRPLGDLVQAAEAAIDGKLPRFVFACANPHSLVVAQEDEEFRSALRQASAVVADGVGCQWAAPLAGIALGPRVTGSDFFEATMRRLDARGGRVLFFGSSRQVLER